MTLRIIQVTDCHLFDDPAALLKGISTRDRLKQVLAALEPDRERTDRLILTGDLAHDDLPQTYISVRALFAPWWSRLRMVPGNHDSREGIALHCHDRIERVEERIVFQEVQAGWRLIGLDSHRPGEVSGELGILQLAWLDRQLKAAPEVPTAIFLHHPPVSVASRWMNEIGLTDVDELWRVLERSPQVRLICAGHVHHELAVSRRGILTFTTPSTGVQFVPEADEFEIDECDPGFRILELESDGSFRTRVIRVRVGS